MNKKLVVSILLTVIYAAITLFAVLHHEIWADEAQVWQLCKYLSLPELFNHLHNEGHPSLFYLLVMPFAKLTSNIIYMQLICWLAMCIAVFLLIYKSPFPNFVKFAIISSAGFLYFFPVIARNYSIIPVLVFFAAILYTKQKEHPVLYAVILALIANTHAIMLGFVSVLIGVFLIQILKEKEYTKPNIASIIVMFGGVLAFIIQLYDTTASNISMTHNNIVSSFIKVPIFFIINSYNQLITIENKFFFPIIDIPVVIIFAVIFILLFINLYFNNRKLFTIGLSSILFQFLVYIFIYSNFQYTTRIFTAYVILIFCFWQLYSSNIFNENKFVCKKKITTVLLSIFFLLTCFNGINYYRLDYKYNYSGAKETSEYIKNNISKDAVILIVTEHYNTANMYYLGDEYNLYSIPRDKNIKYIVWDKYLFMKPEYDYIKALCNFINSNTTRDIYIIFCTVDENPYGFYKKRIDVQYGEYFKKVFASAPSVIKDEGFIIYQYKKEE